MAKDRAPWGHTPRHCVYCGKVGPRTWSKLGLAHKRCIPSDELRERRKADREANSR